MGIQTWLARRRARRIRERAYETPSQPVGTVPMLVPKGETGTEIVYVAPTTTVGGRRITAPTITPTTTPTTITTYPDIKISPEITRQIITQQQIRAGEIYDPRTGLYKAAIYGLGAGGTAYQRYPTYEERRRIQEAKEKPEKWRRYIEDPTGKRALEPPEDVFGETYTYKRLYEIGAMPTIVRKGAADVGRFFVSIGEKITGEEVPPELKTQAAQAIGTLFLFSGFSSAMRTGTYSKEISKQLSKTKFDRLKELLGKAEKQIAEQKTLKDQLKILKQIKDNLKTPEQIKNYNIWVESLKDKGIFHKVKVDVTKFEEYKPSITGEIAIEVPSDIPIGKMGVMGIDVKKFKEVSWIGEKVEVTQPPLSRNIFEQQQKEAQLFVSTTALRLKQTQIQRQRQIQREKFIQPQKEVQLFKQVLQLKQTQIQKQIQIQRQTQRQIQRERLAQLQKQVQVSRLTTKLKLTPLKLFPFKLGEVIKRVKKIAKEEPEVFEAWGKRFGEEIKLGIFRTKPEAEKKLEKFLVKTLGAAGFITKDRKKIKAKEISLLKDIGFRKGKLSEFLIVEKKERRLRVAGTGREIQYFRSKPLKGRRKGKSLFGI